jgi:hypothetical protein
MHCACHYQFEILAKGVQVSHEYNNTTTTQFFPFAQIVSVRHDMNRDDKINTISILLCDGLKYTYHNKYGSSNTESAYKQIVDAMNK